MTNKIPTFKLSLNSVCKTEEEKQQVLRLMISQGADAISINSNIISTLTFHKSKILLLFFFSFTNTIK